MVLNQGVSIKNTREKLLKFSCLGPISPECIWCRKLTRVTEYPRRNWWLCICPLGFSKRWMSKPDNRWEGFIRRNAHEEWEEELETAGSSCRPQCSSDTCAERRMVPGGPLDCRPVSVKVDWTSEESWAKVTCKRKPLSLRNGRTVICPQSSVTGHSPGGSRASPPMDQEGRQLGRSVSCSSQRKAEQCAVTATTRPTEETPPGQAWVIWVLVLSCPLCMNLDKLAMSLDFVTCTMKVVTSA